MIGALDGAFFEVYVARRERRLRVGTGIFRGVKTIIEAVYGDRRGDVQSERFARFEVIDSARSYLRHLLSSIT
jgi:hypothetical protein